MNDTENIQFNINEKYSKPPKKNFITNKTDVYLFDDTWRLDILDFRDYGPEKRKGYRHVLNVVEEFSKFVLTVLLKNKKPQTIGKSFENVLKSFQGKPKVIETYN